MPNLHPNLLLADYSVRFGALADALQHNKTLAHLNLARNRITELSALSLKVPTHLCQCMLSGCCLQEALLSTPHLLSVVLDGNPVGELGGRMIMNARAKAPDKLISFQSCSFAAGTHREL